MTYRSDRRGETPEKPWPLEAVYPVGTPRANFIMARNSNVPFERPKIRMQSICHSTRKSNIRMLKRIFGKRIWDSCAYLTGGVQIRLPRYLRTSPPPCRPNLTLAGCRLARATPPAGLPVLRPIPSSIHATAITPAEPVGARVARFPTAGSLPLSTARVGFRIERFDGVDAPAPRRQNGPGQQNAQGVRSEHERGRDTWAR